MYFKPLTAKMQIQQLDIEVDFPGKLFAATPLNQKPRYLPADTWAHDLLTSNIATFASKAGIKNGFHLAVPTSFGGAENSEDAKYLLESVTAPSKDPNENGILSFIHVVDTFCNDIFKYGETPYWSIETIIAALKAGENVIVLSDTTGISGFIPAIIFQICYGHHVTKTLHPIIGHGYDQRYELTPFQLGYIYGLFDANDYRGSETVRRIREDDAHIA